jgi:flagellar capping protein FliD
MFISGIKNELMVRGMGERLSKMTEKMVLLSINVSNEGLFKGIWEFIYLQLKERM